MDNVLIFSGITSTNTDAVTANQEQMDLCLLTADSNNALKYHALGPCLFSSSNTSTSQVPLLCRDTNECQYFPSYYATQVLSSKPAYETAVGIAKDGHIIVGPYNDEGELWSCEDHDVCNGVYLSDNSYAYAMTFKFPYVVGCWGPAAQQAYPVQTTCSTRACDGSLSGVALSTLALGALVVSHVLA